MAWSMTIVGPEPTAAGIEPKQSAKVSVIRQDGSRMAFDVIVRIDAPAEVEYFVHGGILDMVLRQLLHSPGPSRERRT